MIGTKHFIALCLLTSLLPENASADFSHVIELSGLRRSIDSEQQHKDIETDNALLEYRHYRQQVKPWNEHPAEAEFFSRSDFVSVRVTQERQTPKDDLRVWRAVYDASKPGDQHRLRIGALYANHSTQMTDSHLDGGLLGVTIFLLETGRADFDSEHLSGDGFRITDSSIRYRQVFTNYDYDIVLGITLKHTEIKSPHRNLGRTGSGFIENSWEGRLGWYFWPQFEAGLGHSSRSKEYKDTKNDGALNTAFFYANWSCNENFSAKLEAGLGREIIDVWGLDREFEDESASAALTLTSRF